MKLFFAIILISTIVSCYYDSEEYLYPQINSTCDTTNVKFSTTVKPILQSSCWSCHSNNNATSGGGFRLEDYADVKVSADNGSLLGTISHKSQYNPMPLNGPSLDNCSISIIKLWIDAGAPNN
jgi:hypothetical protein